jgi:hypothetical protein
VGKRGPKPQPAGITISKYGKTQRARERQKLLKQEAANVGLVPVTVWVHEFYATVLDNSNVDLNSTVHQLLGKIFPDIHHPPYRFDEAEETAKLRFELADNKRIVDELGKILNGVIDSDIDDRTGLSKRIDQAIARLTEIEHELDQRGQK